MFRTVVAVDLFTLGDCLNINKSPVNFVTFSIRFSLTQRFAVSIFLAAVVAFFIYSPPRTTEQTDDHCETNQNKREKDFFFPLPLYSTTLYSSTLLYLYRTIYETTGVYGGDIGFRLPNIFLAHRLADCDCLANCHATNYRDALDSCTYRHDAVDFFPPMLLVLHFLSH